MNIDSNHDCTASSLVFICRPLVRFSVKSSVHLSELTGQSHVGDVVGPGAMQTGSKINKGSP